MWLRGRHIGAGIRRVCEALEKLGPCGSRAVANESGIPITSVTRCAFRAEGHGLMVIDRTAYPHVYTVLPDWRYAIEHTKERAKVAAPVVTPPNSIFQMGERAGAQA